MSDYTQKNIEHFDKRADSWDTPSHVEFSKNCSQAFLDADGFDWDPKSTVVLDFACGTGANSSSQMLTIGLISQGLLPHVHKAIGCDVSQGMVDVYNQKASTNGFSDKMHALCIDILSLPVSEIPQELQNVDAVVCSMSFHHIPDIDRLSQVLASLLKKGGHLLVIDLLESPAVPILD